jgi:uncharacterized RDD family membrane protein YckC
MAYGDGPPLPPNSGDDPNYGDVPQPGYGNAPPPGYGNVPQPGYGNVPPPGYGSLPSANYANWAQRVGAYLIDIVPAFIVEIIGIASHTTVLLLLGFLIALGITIYNRWIQAGKTGQSWGKKALGLKLISESTGQPIGAGMAFARDLCHILDSLACYIGWLFPLWDSKRQTFADKILSTVVVLA